MQLKTLLPSLKEKKRYLAFEVISKSKTTYTDTAKAIWNSVLSFAGTSGAARMGINIMTYNNQKGLIRVAHTSLEELKASLTLITTINNEPAIVRSLGASGILAKAKKNYLEG